MRQLKRLRSSIPSLIEHESQMIQRWNSDRNGFKPNFSSIYWRTAEVLGSLYAMHGRVCAYCQGVLTQSDRGDVEHFRPKSIYWWLAYSFKNYLLSCSRCNRIYKKSEFPLLEGAERILINDNSDYDQEARLLIDPVSDPVENWLIVTFVDTICFVDPAPSLELISLNGKRCNFTIKFFKINENGLLVKERTDIIFEALEAAKSLNSEEHKKARRMACRFTPHGIFVRKLFENKFPELVPSEHEELFWLIEDLVDELHCYDRILNRNPDALDAQKLKEIVGWALAVIWKNTTVTNHRNVHTFLNNSGVLEFVNNYYELLA